MSVAWRQVTSDHAYAHCHWMLHTSAPLLTAATDSLCLVFCICTGLFEEYNMYKTLVTKQGDAVQSVCTWEWHAAFVYGKTVWWVVSNETSSRRRGSDVQWHSSEQGQIKAIFYILILNMLHLMGLSTHSWARTNQLQDRDKLWEINFIICWITDNSGRCCDHNFSDCSPIGTKMYQSPKTRINPPLGLT
jgi:hypothetical protein